MSLVGEVYSVLIGPWIDVGSSAGSILIFFFGTACTVQVMDTRDIHTHDMIMTQTVNNNWKMYNRTTTDRNDLEIWLNIFIRINPYLWIVDKKSTNREYGGASFVDKKST